MRPIELIGENFFFRAAPGAFARKGAQVSILLKTGAMGRCRGVLGHGLLLCRSIDGWITILENNRRKTGFCVSAWCDTLRLQKCFKTPSPLPNFRVAPQSGLPI
jgi:hypothetical protein